MATRNSDINLIIRTKTEGDKAVAAMADAVNNLVDDAGALNQTVAGLAALDKAAGGLASAQDKVTASSTKQAQAIHAASAGIAEQQERVETLQRGLGILATEADHRVHYDSDRNRHDAAGQCQDLSVRVTSHHVAGLPGQRSHARRADNGSAK